MVEPMSESRLTEIRERADNATPGPWGVGNGTEIALDVQQTSRGCYSSSVHLASVTEDYEREDDAAYSKRTDYASPEDDALFIAHSRQDVEDLLAEVERLNAYVNTIDRLNEVADADWKQEVDRLKAELAAARGWLTTAAVVVARWRMDKLGGREAMEAIEKAVTELMGGDG